VEYEPGLVQDLPELFENLIPSGKMYQHDATWGDGNGFSHLRASLVGPSLTVPVSGGALTLGTWQQVVFLEFDNRPRRRTVQISILGI
jgi:secondary thiamine-phosphate synthase enzyme